MPLSFARPARLIAAASLPLIFAAAVPVADGTSYEFVMKTQSTQTGDKETVTLRGRGTFSGDDARIEIVDAASSTGGSEVFGGKGTYFVVKNGGTEMLLVDPNQKSYMKWDIANMFAGMSKVVNAVGGLVKMQMSDIKIDAQDMGAGGTIQGYPTRHVRMVQNYTMSASMFGRSSKSRNETTTDYYFAPGLKIANPFVSNSQAMAMMSQLDMFNNPEYKSQMAAANAKLQQGVPLKTVTKTVTTDEKGKQQSSVTIMEMVNFKSANVPASTFAIPSDYKMIEMPSMNANMAADGSTGAQSGKTGDGTSIVGEAKAGATEGLKEGVKEGSKEAAKEAAKKKLKGIFKR
ncbi:MAG TPA: hypothetical protein VM939_06070 [Gemmatimonadaceae bacterium]|nr:hypothetical protein [Gemmatimonadaceae bacterium]